VTEAYYGSDSPQEIEEAVEVIRNASETMIKAIREGKHLLTLSLLVDKDPVRDESGLIDDAVFYGFLEYGIKITKNGTG